MQILAFDVQYIKNNFRLTYLDSLDHLKQNRRNNN